MTGFGTLAHCASCCLTLCMSRNWKGDFSSAEATLVKQSATAKSTNGRIRNCIVLLCHKTWIGFLLRVDSANRRIVKAYLRIAAIVLFVVPALPLQWIALRFGWSLAGRLPQWFHRYAAWVIGMRIAHEGGISTQRPLLLVSNHVSWLDVIVLGSVMPLSFIAKHEVGMMPAFGMLSRMQRTVFVDRSRRSETGDVTRSVAKRLEAGDVMVLFAEGTTGDGTRLLPFRSALLGAARDAGGQETIVALQPVALAYTKRGGLPLTSSARASDIAWTGDIDLPPHLMGILRGGPIDVTISFGKPLSYEQQTDRKKATRQIEAEVRGMLRKTLRAE
jgi:lyso-ornithine lipid O-acyltransferase